jgi:hypothetical protein
MSAIGLIFLKLIDGGLAALTGQLQQPVLMYLPAYFCRQIEITDRF